MKFQVKDCLTSGITHTWIFKSRWVAAQRNTQYVLRNIPHQLCWHGNKLLNFILRLLSTVGLQIRRPSRDLAVAILGQLRLVRLSSSFNGVGVKQATGLSASSSGSGDLCEPSERFYLSGSRNIHLFQTVRGFSICMSQVCLIMRQILSTPKISFYPPYINYFKLESILSL